MQPKLHSRPLLAKGPRHGLGVAGVTRVYHVAIGAPPVPPLRIVAGESGAE